MWNSASEMSLLTLCEVTMTHNGGYRKPQMQGHRVQPATILEITKQMHESSFYLGSRA